MKKCFLLACAVCAYGWVEAATVEISSPDKKLVVAVSDDGGRPSYTVSYDGVVFLEQSPLGLRTNVGDFAQGLALAEADFKSEAATVSYDMRSIKRSHVERQATQAVCPFTKDGKRVMDVVFHVSDNDVAFKYKVYPQRDRLCAVVTGVMWFANDLLISLRGFRATFVGSVVALVTSLAVMVPAVGALGMNGVTVANVASCVASAAFMLWSLRALTRSRFGGAGGAAADGNGGAGDAR